MNNIEETRKIYYITEIKKNKTAINNDVTKIAGLSILIGAGALIINYYGPEVLQNLLSNPEMFFNSRNDYKNLEISAGFSTIIAGMYGIINQMKDIFENDEKLKLNEQILSAIEEKEKSI